MKFKFILHNRENIHNAKNFFGVRYFLDECQKDLEDNEDERIESTWLGFQAASKK